MLGAIVAGAGAWLRASDGWWHRPGAGYLLSAAGLFLSAGGAVWKARTAGLLVVFRARQVRRSALLSGIGGAIVALLGCVFASWASANQPLSRATGEAILTLGIGIGLAGFLSFFWTFGLDYLGERIEKLSEEDW
ncbi:MAG: hypothetical protein AB7G88_10435 [Thermomicrobiales bacterium]